MKKWFIFALIAAVFMVTFTACNKDEEGDDGQGRASPPRADLYESTSGALGSIIVNWNGSPGYDYYVFFEKRDLNGIITPMALAGVKGQTVFQFEEDSTAPYWKLTTAGTSPTKWAIAIGSGGAASGTDIYIGNPKDSFETNGGADTTSVLVDVAALFEEIAKEYKVYKDGDLRTVWYRVGVAAANPGGFPMRTQRTLVYSGWMFE